MYKYSIFALLLLVMSSRAMEQALTPEHKATIVEALKDEIYGTFREDLGIVAEAEDRAHLLAPHNDSLKRDLASVHHAIDRTEAVALQKELDSFCTTWNIDHISVEEACKK